MANIHGFGDMQRINQPANDEYLPVNNMNDLPFFSPSSIVDPRRQGFFSVVRTIFCPFFKPLSFISAMCIIDICVFTVTIIYSLYNNGLDTNNDVLLAPNINTLLLFGAKVLLHNILVSLWNDTRKKTMV